MQSKFIAIDSLEPWDSAISTRLTEIIFLKETGSSQEVSHARIFPSLVKALGFKVPDPAYGLSMLDLLASYDPVTQSWRTSEPLFPEDWIEYSGALPRSGTMRNGKIYAPPTLERPIRENESGLLPTPVATLGTHGGPNQRDSSGRPGLQMAAMMWSTPTVNDAKNSLTDSQRGRGTLTANMVERLWPTPQARDFRSGDNPDSPRAIRKEEQGWSKNLNDAVKLWPTPRTAGMCGGTGNWNQLKEKCADITEARQMGAGNGGQLNPMWVEALMGYPIGWSDISE